MTNQINIKEETKFFNYQPNDNIPLPYEIEDENNVEWEDDWYPADELEDWFE